MDLNFDLNKFLERSRALDLTGIDWSKAKTQPISEAEKRCLTYMIDVESYTIAYMRIVLNTKAIKDREIAEFLPCWAYEEAYHSRALERFLQESGISLVLPDQRSYQRRKRFWESLKDHAAGLISRFSTDFIAVYMTWGAVQEMTTLSGYKNMARKSRNEALAEVVRRIMRDESRHFGFYYNKAKERLMKSPRAQWLTSNLLKHFWLPVGAGIESDSEVAFVTAYLFGDTEGHETARHIDNTIAKLPGLSWFNYFETFTKQCCQRLVAQSPWQELTEQLSYLPQSAVGYPQEEANQ
ncbi:MAG: acyl-ACP desaturase [Acidobacteriota bacterium]